MTSTINIDADATKESASILKQKISETKTLINRAMEAHTFMKTANKYFRKHGTCRGMIGITDEMAANLNRKVDAKSSAPYTSGDLSESNNDINLLKTRLSELQDSLQATL